MSQDAITMVVISAVGTCTSWCVWITVMVFKHKQEIALIKQEISLLAEVKEVLIDIRQKLGSS